MDARKNGIWSKSTCQEALSLILDQNLQKVLNLKVKFRESFSPLHQVCDEHISDWFNFNYTSPYMLLVAKVLDEHRTVISEGEDQLFGIDVEHPKIKNSCRNCIDYTSVATVNKLQIQFITN